VRRRAEFGLHEPEAAGKEPAAWRVLLRSG
jgi:hypothetical protein